MTLKEYKELLNMNMDYLQYVEYLIKKYGPVENNYFRTEECNSETDSKNYLHRHHIYENLIPNLGDKTVAKENDFKYQLAENLVYCNAIEHIILHILIAEETTIAEIGRNGAQILLNYITIDNDLREVLQTRLNATGTLLKHNIDLYNGMKTELITNNKALVILATGGGKTTTALQYLIETGKRALVLAPKDSIVQDWKARQKHYPQIKNAMCYQSFMKIVDIDTFLKDYDIIICDEIHHLAKDSKWTPNVVAAIKNANCQVLGITAEGKRSDNTRVADILFDGKCVKGMTTAEMLKTGIFWPISYVCTLLSVPALKIEAKCAYLQKDLDLALNTTSAKDILLKYRPNYLKMKGIVFIPRGNGGGDNFAEARELIKSAYPEAPIWEINYTKGVKECRKIKEEFEKAECGFIIAIDMISEGIHFTGINTVIILRNSHSPLVVNQQVGRLTRIKREYEQDPNCILFDLVNIIKTVDYRDCVNRVGQSEVGEAIKEMAEKSKSQAVICDDQLERLYKVLERSNAFKQPSLFDGVIVF